MNLNKKIALVLEIQELSMEITNNSNVAIFTEYMGHTNGLYIRIYLDGWKVGNLQPDFIKSLYLDWDCVKDLNNIIDYLKLIKEEIK